jgi:hypothetical protein
MFDLNEPVGTVSFPLAVAPVRERAGVTVAPQASTSTWVQGVLSPPSFLPPAVALCIYFETWPSWIGVLLQYPSYFSHVRLFSSVSAAHQFLSPIIPSTWA